MIEVQSVLALVLRKWMVLEPVICYKGQGNSEQAHKKAYLKALYH